VSKPEAEGEAARSARPRAGRARASGGGRGIPTPGGPARVPVLARPGLVGRDPARGLSSGPGQLRCRPTAGGRPHLGTPNLGNPSPRSGPGTSSSSPTHPKPPQVQDSMDHAIPSAAGPSLHRPLPTPTSQMSCPTLRAAA
jgi:hypothetical protein